MDKPNISDVARKARVAKSTVSRVLNGGYASQEVKDKVMRVVRDLGFEPSATARNLSIGKSGCLGLVSRYITHNMYVKFLVGTQAECAWRNLSLLIGTLIQDKKYDASVIKSWIKRGSVDGLIFIGPNVKEKPLIEAASEKNVPLVLVGPEADFKVGHWELRSPNREAEKKAVEYLVGLGHRRFGFLGGPRASRDVQERYQGFSEGLRENGIPQDPRQVYFGDHGFEPGVTYAQKWLAQPRGEAPTALVCSSDLLAMGFMSAIGQAGIAVPREVSVVGFDDRVGSEHSLPPLTTIRQPFEAMGRAAIKCLVGPPDGMSAPILFPTEFIFRKSTASAGN